MMACLSVLNLTLTVMHLEHLNAALYYCAVCVFAGVLIASVAIKSVSTPIFIVATTIVLVSYIALY